MDRLQVAIEKARTQRAEALENRPEPAVGVPPPPDPAPEEVTPEPAQPAAPAEAEPAAAVPARVPADPASAEAPRVPLAKPGPPRPGVWENLTPIDTSVRKLRDNRLLTFKGGSEAVPFDLLRTRVLHQARKNGWRRIGIVSPTAGCGKTTAAANLAFAFSRQPELRIVMLDLDLRRPQLMQMLGQKVDTSIEDVLRGKIDFADHARVIGSNVAMGFSAGPASNPSELLQSDEAAAMLDRIEADFAPDLSLYDLSPMMATDDNFGFLNRVDCVLVMVAAEQTTMDQIEVTLRQLGDLTRVLGIVLNKCRHISGAYGYDSKYYYS